MNCYREKGGLVERRRRESGLGLATRSVVGSWRSLGRSVGVVGSAGTERRRSCLAMILGWGSGAGGGGGGRVVVGVGSVDWRRCVSGTGKLRAGLQCSARVSQGGCG